MRGEVRLPSEALFLVVGIGIATTARAMTLSFLAIKLQQTFGLGPAMVGFLLGLGSLMGAIAAPLAGALSDKVGRKVVLTSVLAALAVAMTALAIDQVVLLAEMEGKPLAIGAAGPPSASIFGTRGEIKNLYVDPDLKRQGLGRTLLSRLALHLRERGLPGVGVGVVEGNEPAIAFYDALGAKRVGEYTDPGPIWRSRNIVFVWERDLVL